MEMGANRKETNEGFLVTFHGYPLEESMWLPESNFHFPEQLKRQLKQDKPVEDKGAGSRD